MKIGVLALQGDFSEHISMLKRLKIEASEVRLPEHLNGLDGLIIPGGESTTIAKLASIIWSTSCDLGNVCGRDLSFESYQP